jgi:ribosomal-protein-alanine N-acetyltransferase
VGEHPGSEAGVSAVERLPEAPREGDLELTRMRRRHLRKVMSIESRVYPRPWSTSLFLSELAQRATRTYLVARLSGEVAGYAGMMYTGNEAHVTNIAVDPAYHGRKIGTRMLLTIVTEAIARGAEVISLEVRVSNFIAQNMYVKFGFSVAGTRKGYYIETNEDAYVMVVEDARSTDFRLKLAEIRAELEEAQSGE